MLNGSDISVGVKDLFEKELSFTLFYQFIKAYKQYIFNSKIPRNTCLCETCENALFLARGELSICEECKNHGLEQNDYNKRNDETDENDGDSSSSSDSDGECKYYQWKKGADGCLTKIRIETEISESLTLWQTTIEIMKAQIHTKRRQFKEITRITDNLNEDEIWIHLDYSENYKCQHQNKIQNAYFGNKTFSLFTVCTYYKQNKKIQRLPITVTTEEKDKCRAASMSCVKKVITHSIDKINQTISNVYIDSDECAAQFRSRFVFNFLIFFQKDVPRMAL